MDYVLNIGFKAKGDDAALAKVEDALKALGPYESRELFTIKDGVRVQFNWEKADGQ